MGENKLRIITGIVFGAAVIGCLLLGKWTTICLFGVFTITCSLEFFKFFHDKKGSQIQLAYATIALLIFLSPLAHEWNVSPIILTVILFFVWLIIAAFNFKRSILGAFGLLYIPVLFSFVFLFLNESTFFINPWYWILFTIILTWTNDVAAYYTGRTFGKHKLASISPKKTIEGAVGGIVTAIILSAVVLYYAWDIPIWFAGLTGLFIAVAAIFGDLFESMIKRHFTIKDSGNLLPGHGGFLDRLDALIFALPASLLIYKILIT